MKKETIIAVSFGIIFGAVLALILLLKNKELQFNRTKTIAPTVSLNQKAKNLNTTTLHLDISQPHDGDIVNSNKIILKGKTEKGALIVVETASSDNIFKNSNEDFSLSIPLSFGENNILITVYSKDPQTKPLEKELKVFYLDQQL